MLCDCAVREGLPELAKMRETQRKIRISDNGRRVAGQIMVTVRQEMESGGRDFPRDCQVPGLGMFEAGNELNAASHAEHSKK
jgi:hypothetical protein